MAVGAILRATSAETAEFSAGLCVGEYEQTISPSGGAYEAVGQLPAGALVIGVTARVTVSITGCTAWSLGSVVMPEAWGRSIDVTAGTTTTGVAILSGGLTPVGLVAQPALLTAIDGTFAGGSVLLRTYYLELGAP